MTEISFARKVSGFLKLSEYREKSEKQLLGTGLSLLFTRIPNLLGIKDQISQINKDDIKEMLFMRFKNLSLEEIDYAFKLDRFGAFGETTEHFQLFNSVYVAKVLEKYKKWLTRTRFDNNIPLHQSSKGQELSQEDKDRIVRDGIVRCFNDFSVTHKLEDGKSWIYEHLFELGVLPEHTPEFRERMFRKARKKMYKQRKSNPLDRSLKTRLRAIQNGKYKLRTEIRYLILENYFRYLISQRKHISDVALND